MRGDHSTGVLTVSGANNETNIIKCIGGPWNLPSTEKKVNIKCLLGHNRYATQGNINEENAHPFEFENVIGVHNGTIFPHQLKSFPGAGVYSVDSQILYSQLNADPNPGEIWKKVDGPAAMVWWDKRDNKLHIARNLKRPLHYVLSKDKKTIFWASEKWMLAVAASRRSLPIEDVEVIEADKHYTIDHAPNGVIDIVKEDLPDYETSFFPTGKKNGKHTVGATANVFHKDKVNPEAANRFLTINYLVDNKKPFSSYFAGIMLDTGENVNIIIPYVQYEKLLTDIKRKGKSVVWEVPANKIHSKNKSSAHWLEVYANYLTEFKELKDLKLIEDSCCYYCGDKLDSTKSNLVVNAEITLCDECKDLDTTKQILKESGK